MVGAYDKEAAHVIAVSKQKGLRYCYSFLKRVPNDLISSQEALPPKGFLNTLTFGEHLMSVL